MGKVSKSLSLLLVVALAIVSLFAIQPTFAQSLPKPCVPEFTLELINNSSSSIKQSSIAIAIKNQPLASQWAKEFSYNVRVKNHSSQDWISFYFPGTGPKPSNTDYTTILYQVSASSTLINLTSNVGFPGVVWGIERNSPIDFQVEAVMAHSFSDVYPGAGKSSSGMVSEESGWSNTQTISIPSANSSPNPSSTVPELTWLVLFPLSLILLAMALVLKFKAHPMGSR